MYFIYLLLVLARWLLNHALLLLMLSLHGSHLRAPFMLQTIFKCIPLLQRASTQFVWVQPRYLRVKRLMDLCISQLHFDIFSYSYYFADAIFYAFNPLETTTTAVAASPMIVENFRNILNLLRKLKVWWNF